jgi:hypothetical protein
MVAKVLLREVLELDFTRIGKGAKVLKQGQYDVCVSEGMTLHSLARSRHWAILSI